MVFLASKQIMSGVWNRIKFIDLTPPHYSVYSKPKLILASASSFIISRFKNVWFAADY